MCQMTSVNNDIRTVQIKWVMVDELFLHVGKDNWKVPVGVEMPLAIRFDQETPFKVTAKGLADHPRLIELKIDDATDARHFVDQFRTAAKLSISFPGGSAPGLHTRSTGKHQCNKGRYCRKGIPHLLRAADLLGGECDAQIYFFFDLSFRHLGRVPDFLATTEKCHSLGSVQERQDCYVKRALSELPKDQHAAASVRAEPTKKDSVDELTDENARVNFKLKGICRGC
jgi:hypothetical protein